MSRITRKRCRESPPPFCFQAEKCKECRLYGETVKGYGHNAHPVRDEGVACDACNGAIVLPQRFRKWGREPPSRPERDRRPVAAGSALRCDGRRARTRAGRFCRTGRWTMTESAVGVCGLSRAC